MQESSDAQRGALARFRVDNIPSAEQCTPVAHRLQRRTLGEKFSEGARQAWIAIEREAKKAETPIDHSALARRLGCAKATLHRILYGDAKPDAERLVAFERIYGVRCRLWYEPAKNHFVPPAARAA